MGKVARLSDALINKIAAGEVVERPASVVKELVENALDAGATSVRVSLSGGGLRSIAVVDDGHGMSREDAVEAMTRHATSKLREVDDLFNIRTLGFRGEALPAIASVSRFTLLTCEPGAAVGTRIELEGSGPMRVEDAAPVGGTRLRVDDLFFNTPARRKFLRSEQTELGHCEEALVRIALARPDVGFHLEHDGKVRLSSPPTPGDLRERIAAALGSEVHRFLVPVEERRLGVRVHGFIARPEYNRSNARGIYTFVNRRYVRDRALNASIQRAFSEVLPGGRQPVVVLFIEVDPRDVDVNVHPQKLEVRFQDVRGVSDALFHAIARGLKDAAPETDPAVAPGAGDASQYALAVERFLQRAQQTGTLDGAPPLVAQDGPFARPPEPSRAPAFGEARPGINEAPPPGWFSGLQFVGALSRRYWICEAAGGTLTILDPHAAAERVHLARLCRAFDASAPPAPSLFSATVELPPPEARILGAGIPALQRLGFDLEPFGGTSFAVRAVPPGLETADVQVLLAELCATLPRADAPLTSESLGAALRLLACHAARASGVDIPEEARRALFRELDAAEVHPGCRHPRVVLLELPLLELERRARGLDRE